jgi:cysteine desulfurase/selenocysteine lyase
MDIQKIREDFPPLSRLREGKPPIYLDNAGMTLKPKPVINSMNEYYTRFPSTGGHGRGAHWFAKETIETTEKAREKICNFINAETPSEIIWTKNTTEGINLLANSLNLKKGDVIIATDKEHNSNLVPWIQLKKKKGIGHIAINSKEDNSFDLELFEEKMNKNVKVVSVYHSSNLDGYTIPAKEIIKIAHDYDAIVILDGAQSVPHKKIDVKKLDIDFLCFSIHKMCGPTEIPYSYEAGLQNYAGQIGAGAAAKYLQNISMKKIEQYDYKLNKNLTKEIKKYPEIRIIGPKDPKERSGILSFRIEKEGKLLIQPQIISELLDKESNIMTRSGCLCVHSWFNSRNMDIGVTRVSVYFYNTKDEIKIFLSTLKKIMENIEKYIK